MKVHDRAIIFGIEVKDEDRFNKSFLAHMIREIFQGVVDETDG